MTLSIVQPEDVATPAAIAERLRKFQFRFSNEDQLQAGVYAALTQAFPLSDVRREVTLAGDLGRVDVMVDRIAIEIKISSQASRGVAEQVRRYATAGEVDGVVLVTNQVAHGAGSGVLEGKPMEIVSLIGSQL